LPEKEGILEYYNLVKDAGVAMPDQWMQGSWLWRMYMQKGALDRYVQLAVAQQMALQNKIEDMVQAALDQGDISSLNRGVAILQNTPGESDQMKRLRLEAESLGVESNRLFGVRNDGIFNYDHDFIGLGWLKRQLSRALQAKEPEQSELLRMIVDYDNPGEGGKYDNLGTFNAAPNLVFGYPYDHGQPYVSQMLAEGNRPSQRSMHFTQDEAQGVTLRYDNLDSKSKYRIRLTLVRPWYQERYAMRMNQSSQSIYADDELLAKDVELPMQMSDLFSFDIPAKATQDGSLTIRFEKSQDVANGDRVSVEQWRNSGGWGTIVSEVWLIKK